jgi:hypothetical protein
MAFLILLSINVLGSDPVGYQIRYYEWLLWGWLVASTLEEMNQYSQEPSTLSLFLTILFHAPCTSLAFSLARSLTLYFCVYNLSTEEYFNLLSNQMDTFMYLGLLISIAQVSLFPFFFFFFFFFFFEKLLVVIRNFNRIPSSGNIHTCVYYFHFI